MFLKSKIRDKINKHKIKFESYKQRESYLCTEIESEIQNLEHAKDALSYLYDVLKTIQAPITNYFSTLVSEALKIVFEDDAYKFVVQLVFKRNKLECEFFFERDGELYDPLDSCGFGTVDVAALILMLANIKLKGLPLITFQDEPLRHLDETRQRTAAIMLSRILEQLGMKCLMITHSDNFNSNNMKRVKI